jgi:hypothetical protein
MVGPLDQPAIGKEVKKALYGTNILKKRRLSG